MSNHSITSPKFVEGIYVGEDDDSLHVNSLDNKLVLISKGRARVKYLDVVKLRNFLSDFINVYRENMRKDAKTE